MQENVQALFTSLWKVSSQSCCESAAAPAMLSACLLGLLFEKEGSCGKPLAAKVRPFSLSEPLSLAPGVWYELLLLPSLHFLKASFTEGSPGRGSALHLTVTLHCFCEAQLMSGLLAWPISSTSVGLLIKCVCFSKSTSRSALPLETMRRKICWLNVCRRPHFI